MYAVYLSSPTIFFFGFPFTSSSDSPVLPAAFNAFMIKARFGRPTPVQAQVWPAACAGRYSLILPPPAHRQCACLLSIQSSLSGGLYLPSSSLTPIVYTLKGISWASRPPVAVRRCRTYCQVSFHRIIDLLHATLAENEIVVVTHDTIIFVSFNQTIPNRRCSCFGEQPC